MIETDCEPRSRRLVLTQLLEPDVGLAIRKSASTGGYCPGAYFVDGFKILNDEDPLRKWVRSRRPSPRWLEDRNFPQPVFRIPHTAQAAARILRGMPAALILLDHQNPHRWPSPFGTVWVRIDHPETADEDGAVPVSAHYCLNSVTQQWGATIRQEEERRSRLYDGFLGDNFYQDGGKFSIACQQLLGSHLMSPRIVAIKDAWLGVIASELNAFLQLKRDEENKRMGYL